MCLSSSHVKDSSYRSSPECILRRWPTHDTKKAIRAGVGWRGGPEVHTYVAHGEVTSSGGPYVQSRYMYICIDGGDGTEQGRRKQFTVGAVMVCARSACEMFNVINSPRTYYGV